MKDTKYAISIIIVGCLWLLTPRVVSSTPMIEAAWESVGVIYMLTAISYEVRDSLSFPYAVGVSVVGVSITILARVRGVWSAQSTVTVPELWFVLAQPPVLLAVVVAFVAPLAYATGRRRRFALLAAVGTPYAFALAQTWGSGVQFYLLSVAATFGLGLVVGLPLFRYALRCKSRDRSVPVRAQHAD